jgi:hypothetical protein
MTVLYVIECGRLLGSDRLFVSYDRKTTRLTEKVKDHFKKIALFHNIKEYDIDIYIESLYNEPIKKYKGFINEKYHKKPSLIEQLKELNTHRYY